MATRTTAAALALAVLAMLSGCVRWGPTSPTVGPPEPPPTGAPLAAEVLEFEPEGYARAFAALSDEPIALPVFAGWYAQAEVPDEPPPAAGPGRTYLAVGSETGCRAPTGVAVHRGGDDLQVRFTGGTDHPTCTRPYGPAATLSLAGADVAGVATVNGEVPVEPTGPGVLTAFVALGTATFGRPAPVELGADITELVAALGRSATPDVLAALDRSVTTGSRAFAFLLSGCQDTGAVLLVNYDWIDAEPTGGEGVTCVAAEHYLAVFEISADLVPPGATLGRG